MATRPKKLIAPAHLSTEARAWWEYVRTEWQLEQHHVLLLTLAAETWDRGAEARRILAREGLVIVDRYQVTKPHPCSTIARDAAATFEKLLRALDLDVAAAPTSLSRLPRSTRR